MKPLYELITPSDPITFRAANDNVAFVCAVTLGNGKAGCSSEDGRSIDTMFMFMDEKAVEKKVKKQLGCTLDEFIKKNKPAIREAFASFAYGTFENRRTFDDAVAAITDPVKLRGFKAKHEDRNRSSLSEWVKTAWDYAERLT